MYSGRFLITSIVIVAFVFAGCVKKSKQAEDKEFSVGSNSKQTTSPTDGGDIFDEFYKDEPSSTVGTSKTTPQKQVTLPSSASGNSFQFSENGRYVVQVSTVRSRALADDLAAKLNAKGYPAYVAEVQSPTPSLTGTYYRIRIGGFTQVSAAKAFGQDALQTSGYDYWVDNRSNDNVGIEGLGQADYSTYSAPNTSTWNNQSGTTPAQPANQYVPTPEPPAPSAAQSAPTSAPPAPVPTTEPTPAAAPVPAPNTTNPASEDVDWGTESGW